MNGGQSTTRCKQVLGAALAVIVTATLTAAACTSTDDSAIADPPSATPETAPSTDAPTTSSTIPTASCDEFEYRDDAEWSLAHDFYRYASLVEDDSLAICTQLPYVNPPTSATTRPSSGSGSASTDDQLSVAEQRERYYETHPRPEPPEVTPWTPAPSTTTTYFVDPRPE